MLYAALTDLRALPTLATPHSPPPLLVPYTAAPRVIAALHYPQCATAPLLPAPPDTTALLATRLLATPLWLQQLKTCITPTAVLREAPASFTGPLLVQLPR